MLTKIAVAASIVCFFFGLYFANKSDATRVSAQAQHTRDSLTIDSLRTIDSLHDLDTVWDNHAQIPPERLGDGED